MKVGQRRKLERERKIEVGRPMWEIHFFSHGSAFSLSGPLVVPFLLGSAPIKKLILQITQVEQRESLL